MSDTPPPGEPNRESIPLLLARTRASKAPPPPASSPPPRPSRAPDRSLRAAALRGDAGALLGFFRSRLGAVGTLAALTLVLSAIFAEMLASDLPIACKLNGRTWLFPNVVQPAELTSMDRGALARESEWSIGALVPHGPRTEDKARVAARPGAGHPFGTDREGRDVFARVVHGTRSYLVFALGAVLASLALGGLLGALAGLFGGASDALVGRAIETVSAFPPLVLVLGIQAAVPRATLATLFLAIALTRWPEVARLVRAEVMQVATRDYVLAARALGASPFRVLRRHIAPNVRGQLIVLGAIGVPAVVLIEASLDFLRVGVPTGAASWGETMSEFRDAPHAWWLLLFPGLFTFVTVVAMNLVGEARREATDPRAR